MEWEYEKDGYSSGTVAADSCVSAAMKDLCLHIERDIFPRNQGVDWDHLLVRISPDSGVIAVLPASTGTIYRIEKAGCLLVFEELSQRYQQLADSDLQDVDFDASVEAEERKWCQYFLRAARDTKLQGLRVICKSGGSDDVLEDVIL